jgi:hypothetical protein
MRVALDGPDAAKMIDVDVGRRDDLRRFGKEPDLQPRIERFRRNVSRQRGAASDRQENGHCRETPPRTLAAGG